MAAATRAHQRKEKHTTDGVARSPCGSAKNNLPQVFIRRENAPAPGAKHRRDVGTNNNENVLLVPANMELTPPRKMTIFEVGNILGFSEAIHTEWQTTR